MITPSDTQKRVRDHASLALLLVAPAGCGKTETLAMRIARLIDRHDVSVPRRVLVTTFTNRSKDNLRSRLRDHISAARLRDHVTVSNFHGLAARIIRAHGNVIGIDPTIELPENDWVGEQLHQLGVQYKAKDAAMDILRTTKQQALSDDQVAVALDAHGDQTAIALEKKRIAENRATYDDLLRYAELILANDAVADLYRNHFGAVIVDEYQDLTPQQLRVLTRIGEGRITFAGDLAQGIYGFAGASPSQIDAIVRAAAEDIIEFNESHRSSPAVLGLVNSLNPITGGQCLQCADPASWPNGGLAALATFSTAYTEAASVTRLARRILGRAPNHRVGVISRVKSRLRFIDAAIEAAGLPLHRWEDGVLDTDTAKLVRALLRRLDVAELATVSDRLTHLRDLAAFDRVEEPDTRKALVDALGWVLDRLQEGLTPTQVAGRIRVGDQTTLLNAPGIHLLSGHVGKGQQFDWVVVVGAEDGNIPFFLAQTEAEKLEEARMSLSGGLYTSVSNYGAAWENDVYGGINFGFFDAAGNYWIGNASTSGSGVIYQVDLRTGYVYPLAGQNAAVRSNDLAFAFGYAWGVKNDTNQFQRVNLATGAVETFAGTASMLAGTYGAAWTYGNGNLGFDINTGGVYQVQVLNPTTATPSFVLVAKSAGPASFNNDGTSCVGRPTDLSILKTLSSATVTAGGTATWNLTVKNEGTTASSGFTVTDIVPSTYTTVTATMPTGTGTCTVSGNTVTCVSSGVLQPGETRTITITAKAPASGCATNTARVVGNEDDPNPENDYSSAQTCVTGSAPATCDSVMYGSIDAGGSTSTYGSIGTAYPTLAKKQSIDLNSTYDSTSAISVSAFDANIVYYTARTPAGQSNFNHTLVAMNLATGIETVVNNSSPSAWDTNRLATAPDGTIWSLGDGGVLWSWNPADGNVAATNWGVPSVVDGDGKTISFGSLDSGDITFDGFGNLWVVGAYATNPKAVLATISATSLTTSNPVGSFVGYMTSPSTPANAYFNGLAFAPDGTLVASSTYVGTSNSSALWKVNPTTGETTAIQTGISSATYGYIADLGSCSFPKPNLSIEKSVSPSGPVQPGAVLTYTVVLRNTGQLGATGVQFMDELPSGVTYVPGSTTLNTTQLADTNGRVPFSDYRYVNGARATANNVGYIGGTADAPPTGDVATITFQVTVGTDYSAPQVCNTGTAMFADASHASIRSDNPVTPESGDPTCVAIARPTFGVQKSAAGGEPGGTGTAVRVSPDGKATVTYTVVVTNNGLLATKHPQIDDQLTLPTGFALDGQTPVVVTNANGAVVASSTTTSVTIPAGTADLAVGASATYTVTVTVKAANIATTDWTAAGNCNTHLGGTAASGGVFNVVSMTDDADGADNNDACVPILPPPSVTLLKTGPDGQVLTGATFQLYSPNATTPLGTPMTVGTDGKVTWQNLNPGTYWVKETVAPTGYALDTRTYGFTVGGDGTLTLAADNPANPSLGVSTDGQLLTFRNLHKLEYPAAGGVGSVPFAVIGLLLMALGAYRLRPRGAYMS